MKEDSYVNDFWKDENELPHQTIIETIEYRKIGRILKESNNILIFAGAGTSQESGLPTFNSTTSKIFDSASVTTCNDSSQTNLIDLFDSHKPHRGYSTLLKICKGKNYYVLTSNIDGYFERAGFDPTKIIEVHGNINYVQCPNKCDDKVIKIDSQCSRCKYLQCKHCKYCKICDAKMVPNVMTAGFHNFIEKTKDIDKAMYNDITKDNKKMWTIIEIGSGINIPVIRDYSEILLENNTNINLIRINPIHWQVPVSKELLSKNVVRIPHNCIKGLDIVKSCIFPVK